MSDRRSPDLSTESGSSYRRGGSKPGKRPDAKKSGGVGKQLGMNLVMAVLLGGLVLAGWFIANQQQILKAEQARVDEANARLAKLEARLVATDTVLSEEGQDTKQQINLWESEIRKLWAVSNDRNKKWIQDNQTALKKIADSINGIEASTRDLNAAVGRHEQAFGQQQAIADNLTSMELQVQQLVRGQRDLVDKVNAASQAVASLRVSLAGKVDDNSEAIASMDAYRVAVNSRLAEIERRLGTGAGLGGR